MNQPIISRYIKKGETCYRYRVYTGVTTDGVRKTLNGSGYKTEKEANAAAFEALKTYEQYQFKKSLKANTSYEDLMKLWLDDCYKRLKPVTVDGYRKRAVNQILPVLGKYAVKDITKAMLKEFYYNQLDNGCGSNAFTSIRGIVHSSLQYAVDNEIIANNPASDLKINYSKAPSKPVRTAPHSYINAEEFDIIIKRFPEGHPSYLPLQIAYSTGMRLGEVFGLTWEDVSFENNTITVSRQVQWYQDKTRTRAEKSRTNGGKEAGGGYWYLTTPKYNSYRSIYMDSVLKEILQKEYNKQEKAKIFYEDYYTRYYGEHPLCFEKNAPATTPPDNRIYDSYSVNEHSEEIHFIMVRDNGTYITPRTLQHTTTVINKQLGIKFDFHSLRHTHATDLRAKYGCETAYSSKRLGHKKMEVTVGIYQNHITEEEVRDGNQKVEEYAMKMREEESVQEVKKENITEEITTISEATEEEPEDIELKGKKEMAISLARNGVAITVIAMAAGVSEDKVRSWIG